MTVTCAASCVFILLMTAEFIYTRQSTALSPSEPVALDNGAVRIPVASVSGGDLHHFELRGDGTSVHFIVIEKPDHTLATAFDACAICGAKGYYQKGPEVICRNCGSAIVISTIGISGGCNPMPLKSRVDGATLVIDEAALEPTKAVGASPSSK